MVYSEGCTLLHQAMPGAILKHPDCLFYLPIGFTIANGDVVVDDTQPFAEACKAVCKPGAILFLDIAWLAITGQPGHYTEAQLPSSCEVRAQHGSLPTWKMDPWQQSNKSFHPHPMGIDTQHQCSIQWMVHHLFLSSIALP